MDRNKFFAILLVAAVTVSFASNFMNLLRARAEGRRDYRASLEFKEAANMASRPYWVVVDELDKKHNYMIHLRTPAGDVDTTDVWLKRDFMPISLEASDLNGAHVRFVIMEETADMMNEYVKKGGSLPHRWLLCRVVRA